MRPFISVALGTDKAVTCFARYLPSFRCAHGRCGEPSQARGEYNDSVGEKKKHRDGAKLSDRTREEGRDRPEGDRGRGAPYFPS